jgi:hypothetical protein
MKKIKINFVDFWDNFVKNDNYFFHLLSSKYEVSLDEEDPDILFFSVDYAKKRDRDKYLNHRSKKIFFTGENVRPNFFFPGSLESERYSLGKCDFAFSFDDLNIKKNYRLPLWTMFINWFNVPHDDKRDQSYLIPLENLINRKKTIKTKFCNFVFSNDQGKRLEILESIQKYKSVDCAGRLSNNMNPIVGRGDQKYKINFIKDYKFTIAAENSKYNGYTTEKIIHPLSVGSIPIYWGSDTVAQDFNKECFINASDFKNFDELADYIKFVDSSEEEYNKIISAPIFKNNTIPDRFTPEAILKYFEDNIIC